MTVHTIKSGETLTSIAKKYNTTVDKLAEQNNIKNKNIIVTGKTLNVGDGFEKKEAEVPPMLKRPEEKPVTTPIAPAKKETPAQKEGPSTGETIAKSIFVPGYATLKLGQAAAGFVSEHREQIADTASEAAKYALLPGYTAYKLGTSEPVKNAAKATKEFVEEHKDDIKHGAKEAAKHAIIPGYTAYKVATSEPVKEVATAAVDGAKKAGSAVLNFVKWLYE